MSSRNGTRAKLSVTSLAPSAALPLSDLVRSGGLTATWTDSSLRMAGVGRCKHVYNEAMLGQDGMILIPEKAK